MRLGIKLYLISLTYDLDDSDGKMLCIDSMFVSRDAVLKELSD
jgi:hypothetical protein